MLDSYPIFAVYIGLYVGIKLIGQRTWILEKVYGDDKPINLWDERPSLF